LNDFHGYLLPSGTRFEAPDPAHPGKTLAVQTGGAAELATLVHALSSENPNHIVVGAGDMVGASPLISGLFLDEPSIEVLDEVGLELTSVGNHEFDRGVAELLRKQHGGCASTDVLASCKAGHPFTGAHFQYLAANVVERANGEPILPAYAVRRFGGQPIAFIGVTLKGTGRIVAPSGIESVEFRDEADTVNALVERLRAEGIHSFVLLIHQGGTTADPWKTMECDHFEGEILPILERLDPDVSLVVSGHTHQAYVCSYRGFLVTSAASYSRLVTDIDLAIDARSGRIVEKTATNHVVAGPSEPGAASGHAYPALAPDPAVALLVRHYEELSRPLAGRPVGRITEALSRQGGRTGESPLGDVIADAQWAATQASAGAQLAFTNPGGIRTDLAFQEGGIVSYGAVFAAQPFGNTLVTETLTGAQIKAILEEQWVAHPERPVVLQVSDSFRYAYDLRRPPGERIVADSMTLAGAPLSPDGHYRVTINSFLAAGGDGFVELTNGAGRVVGILDADALEAYLAAHAPLAAPASGRIRALP
jgi:5'-nucleotidase